MGLTALSSNNEIEVVSEDTTSSSTTTTSSTTSSTTTTTSTTSTTTPASSTLSDVEEYPNSCESCATCGKSTKCLQFNEKLIGTAKAHRRHVLVCSGNRDWSWPKKVIKLGGSVGNQTFSIIKQDAPQLLEGIDRVLISEVDESTPSPSSGPDTTPTTTTDTATTTTNKDEDASFDFKAASQTTTPSTDIIIFPEGVRYKDAQNSLSVIVSRHLVQGQLVDDGSVKYVRALPEGVHLVLVCTHGQKDKRCGRAGPQIVKRLKEVIKTKGLEDKVLVWGSSHISGHKYAGVVVVYPEGDWYGYVTGRSIESIVDSYINNTAISAQYYRGRMGQTKQEQKEEARKLGHIIPTTVVPS